MRSVQQQVKIEYLLKVCHTFYDHSTENTFQELSRKNSILLTRENRQNNTKVIRTAILSIVLGIVEDIQDPYLLIDHYKIIISFLILYIQH